MSNDSEEKNLPPSAKRIRDLRRKGTVPTSRDLPGLIKLIVIVLYLSLGFKHVAEQFYNIMVLPQLTTKTSFGNEIVHALQLAGSAVMGVLTPMFALAIIAAVAVAIVDLQGLPISEQAFKLDFNRLNPVNGIKQIFSKRNLSELGKSFLLVILMLSTATLVVRYYLNDVFWAPTCGMNCVLNTSLTVLMVIVAIGIALLIIMAGIDVPLSRALFKAENKMSVTDQKREQKEEYGSPEIRRARRERRNNLMESAGNVGIGRANIVLTFGDATVGLRYVRGETPAPVVVAKGTGEMGASHRKTAQAAGTIFYEDEVTADLLKRTPIGDFIPRAYFDQVAGILLRTGLVS